MYVIYFSFVQMSSTSASVSNSLIPAIQALCSAPTASCRKDCTFDGIIQTIHVRSKSTCYPAPVVLIFSLSFVTNSFPLFRTHWWIYIAKYIEFYHDSKYQEYSVGCEADNSYFSIQLPTTEVYGTQLKVKRISWY